jgi:hypothetical protein
VLFDGVSFMSAARPRHIGPNGAGRVDAAPIPSGGSRHGGELVFQMNAWPSLAASTA